MIYFYTWYKKFLFLMIAVVHSADAAGWVDSIRVRLQDPIISTALHITLSVVVPLVAQKYELFESAEVLASRKVIRQQTEINNHQFNESNNKKIEKMAIENAQERLVTVYRSQEQLEQYRLYKESIPNDLAYRTQKAEAEVIYAALVVDYGKFFQKVLEKNREAIEKIDEEYAAYVSQNNAKNA